MAGQTMPSASQHFDKVAAGMIPRKPRLGPRKAPMYEAIPAFRLPPPARDAEWPGDAFDLNGMAAPEPPRAPALRPAPEPVELWLLDDFQLPDAAPSDFSSMRSLTEMPVFAAAWAQQQRGRAPYEPINNTRNVWMGHNDMKPYMKLNESSDDDYASEEDNLRGDYKTYATANKVLGC
mmetsp:Transcript_42346/g.112048  ORF Transcript_42346/g.112048 Transcript_42346/m.112048 type:complete len:178 (-) Transcript_42346:160-693(-)